MQKNRLTVNLDSKDYEKLEKKASKRCLSRAAFARSLIVEGLEDEG